MSARKIRRLKPSRDQKLESREMKEELRHAVEATSGRALHVIWDGTKPIVGPAFVNNPLKTMEVNFMD